MEHQQASQSALDPPADGDDQHILDDNGLERNSSAKDSETDLQMPSADLLPSMLRCLDAKVPQYVDEDMLYSVDAPPLWIQQQRVFFTRWANMFMGPKSVQLNDVIDDFRSGVLLCDLIEAVFNVSVAELSGRNIIKSPRNHFYMRQNVGAALRAMRAMGILPGNEALYKQAMQSGGSAIAGGFADSKNPDGLDKVERLPRSAITFKRSSGAPAGGVRPLQPTDDALQILKSSSCGKKLNIPGRPCPVAVTAAGIVDGDPQVTLELMWFIVLGSAVLGEASRQLAQQWAHLVHTSDFDVQFRSWQRGQFGPLARLPGGQVSPPAGPDGAGPSRPRGEGALFSDVAAHAAKLLTTPSAGDAALASAATLQRRTAAGGLGGIGATPEATRGRTLGRYASSQSSNDVRPTLSRVLASIRGSTDLPPFCNLTVVDMLHAARDCGVDLVLPADVHLDESSLRLIDRSVILSLRHHIEEVGFEDKPHTPGRGKDSLYGRCRRSSSHERGSRTGAHTPRSHSSPASRAGSLIGSPNTSYQAMSPIAHASPMRPPPRPKSPAGSPLARPSRLRRKGESFQMHDSAPGAKNGDFTKPGTFEAALRVYAEDEEESPLSPDRLGTPRVDTGASQESPGSTGGGPGMGGRRRSVTAQEVQPLLFELSDALESMEPSKRFKILQRALLLWSNRLIAHAGLEAVLEGDKGFAVSRGLIDTILKSSRHNQADSIAATGTEAPRDRLHKRRSSEDGKPVQPGLEVPKLLVLTESRADWGTPAPSADNSMATGADMNGSDAGAGSLLDGMNGSVVSNATSKKRVKLQQLQGMRRGWSNGVALAAVMHTLAPKDLPLSSILPGADSEESATNFKNACQVASSRFGIPPLLIPKQAVVNGALTDGRVLMGYLLTLAGAVSQEFATNLPLPPGADNMSTQDAPSLEISPSEMGVADMSAVATDGGSDAIPDVGQLDQVATPTNGSNESKQSAEDDSDDDTLASGSPRRTGSPPPRRGPLAPWLGGTSKGPNVLAEAYDDAVRSPQRTTSPLALGGSSGPRNAPVPLQMGDSPLANDAQPSKSPTSSRGRSPPPNQRRRSPKSDGRSGKQKTKIRDQARERREKPTSNRLRQRSQTEDEEMANFFKEIQERPSSSSPGGKGAGKAPKSSAAARNTDILDDALEQTQNDIVDFEKHADSASPRSIADLAATAQPVPPYQEAALDLLEMTNAVPSRTPLHVAREMNAAGGAVTTNNGPTMTDLISSFEQLLILCGSVLLDNFDPASGIQTRAPLRRLRGTSGPFVDLEPEDRALLTDLASSLLQPMLELFKREINVDDSQPSEIEPNADDEDVYRRLRPLFAVIQQDKARARVYLHGLLLAALLSDDVQALLETDLMSDTEEPIDIQGAHQRVVVELARQFLMRTYVELGEATPSMTPDAVPATEEWQATDSLARAAVRLPNAPMVANAGTVMGQICIRAHSQDPSKVRRFRHLYQVSALAQLAHFNPHSSKQSAAATHDSEDSDGSDHAGDAGDTLNDVSLFTLATALSFQTPTWRLPGDQDSHAVESLISEAAAAGLRRPHGQHNLTPEERNVLRQLSTNPMVQANLSDLKNNTRDDRARDPVLFYQLAPSAQPDEWSQMQAMLAQLQAAQAASPQSAPKGSPANSAQRSVHSTARSAGGNRRSVQGEGAMQSPANGARDATWDVLQRVYGGGVHDTSADSDAFVHSSDAEMDGTGHRDSHGDDSHADPMPTHDEDAEDGHDVYHATSGVHTRDQSPVGSDMDDDQLISAAVEYARAQGDDDDDDDDEGQAGDDEQAWPPAQGRHSRKLSGTDVLLDMYGQSAQRQLSGPVGGGGVVGRVMRRMTSQETDDARQERADRKQLIPPASIAGAPTQNAHYQSTESADADDASAAACQGSVSEDPIHYDQQHDDDHPFLSALPKVTTTAPDLTVPEPTEDAARPPAVPRALMVLYSLFHYYASLGDPTNATTMTNQQFRRFCRDCGALEKADGAPVYMRVMEAARRAQLQADAPEADEEDDADDIDLLRAAAAYTPSAPLDAVMESTREWHSGEEEEEDEAHAAEPQASEHDDGEGSAAEADDIEPAKEAVAAADPMEADENGAAPEELDADDLQIDWTRSGYLHVPLTMSDIDIVFTEALRAVRDMEEVYTQAGKRYHDAEVHPLSNTPIAHAAAKHLRFDHFLVALELVAEKLLDQDLPDESEEGADVQLGEDSLFASTLSGAGRPKSDQRTPISEARKARQADWRQKLPVRHSEEEGADDMTIESPSAKRLERQQRRRAVLFDHLNHEYLMPFAEDLGQQMIAKRREERAASLARRDDRAGAVGQSRLSSYASTHDEPEHLDDCDVVLTDRGRVSAVEYERVEMPIVAVMMDGKVQELVKRNMTKLAAYFEFFATEGGALKRRDEELGAAARLSDIDPGQPLILTIKQLSSGREFKSSELGSITALSKDRRLSSASSNPAPQAEAGASIRAVNVSRELQQLFAITGGRKARGRKAVNAAVRHAPPAIVHSINMNFNEFLRFAKATALAPGVLCTSQLLEAFSAVASLDIGLSNDAFLDVVSFPKFVLLLAWIAHRFYDRIPKASRHVLADPTIGDEFGILLRFLGDSPAPRKSESSHLHTSLLQPFTFSARRQRGAQASSPTKRRKQPDGGATSASPAARQSGRV